MKSRWPVLFVVVVVLGLTAGVIITAWSAARMGLPGNRAFSTEAALLASIVIIGVAYCSFFGIPGQTSETGTTKAAGNGGEPPARYTANENDATADNPAVNAAIAFDIIVFLVLGFAAIVAATSDWPVAALWAGASLFVGGITGLIFGLPTEAAEPARTTETTGIASASTGQGTNTIARTRRTLISETAGTLRTFVSGALVATAKDLYNAFGDAANKLAACLNCCGKGNSSLAGGLIVYFLSLGFISGLVLPRYFLGRILDGLGTLPPTRVGTPPEPDQPKPDTPDEPVEPPSH